MFIQASENKQNLLRLCIACRTKKPRSALLRLTADHASAKVVLNEPSLPKNQHVYGRSAYLCKSQGCLAAALKGTRLKLALEGRKVKNEKNRRFVSWPLEAQLIKDLSHTCTQLPQTCKNTVKKEGGE